MTKTFPTAMPSSVLIAEQLYLGVLGRAPDDGGLRYHVDQLDNGGLETLHACIDAMLRSEEFHARWTSSLGPQTISLDFLYPEGPDLVVDFGDHRAASVMDKGWSVVERGYTWSTGEESTLCLGTWGQPGDAMLFLNVEPNYEPDLRPAQRLGIFINDVEVAHEVVPGSGPRAVMCEVPGAVIASKASLTLRFTHPDWLRPCDMAGGGGDMRELSFMFQELRLTTLSEAFRRRRSVLRRAIVHPIASSREKDFRAEPLDKETLTIGFESLGLNCEFGFAQRDVGAEPISLLRFNGLPFRKLIKGVRTGFAGLAEGGNLEIRLIPELVEFMGYEAQYMMIYHTARHPPESDAKTLLGTERLKLRFLARKLMEDLEDGEKIFVLKKDEGLLLEEVMPLIDLVTRNGGTLLWVTLADAEHPAGSVDLVEPHLMLGYVDRFAKLARGPGDISHAIWQTMLANAHALRQGQAKSVTAS